MFVRWLLPALWALSAEADFFQFDSISNVSTYYFNYIYCNIWEGDCQPNQDDATQQGKRRFLNDFMQPELLYHTMMLFMLHLPHFVARVTLLLVSACLAVGVSSSYQGPVGRFSSGLR